MRRVLLGEIVARDGQYQVRRFGRVRDAKHGAREECAVRAGRGEALELAGGGGVDLHRQPLGPRGILFPAIFCA